MSVGFIILRHVNSFQTNKYWIHSYHCIRKNYPDNWIMIIDDNSNDEFVDDIELHNTKIINSRYKKRGELLPFIYYLKHKLFDTAVIIHDSVFINNKINTNTDTYRFLWEFEHHWDQTDDERKLLSLFNDNELLNFHNDKTLWKGCFGEMMIVRHDFLKKVNSKYEFSLLVPFITSRFRRQSLERVIACMFQSISNQTTMFGNIQASGMWGTTFDNIHKLDHMPIAKCWSGR